MVAGLNHKSAPIDVREKVAFCASDTIKALKELKSRFGDMEFVLLSTCNRVELYGVGSSSTEAGAFNGEELIRFLLEFHNLERDDFQEFMYVHRGVDAVRHLLMVASSLDSMIVGESQIIAQVKESYSLACLAKSSGKILNRLFHCAFATGKKVHTTTSISSGRVSVAGVAVELATQLFSDICSAKVVVIGVGEMSELLVQHFLHIGNEDITVVNRSYDRGLDMANRYGIKGQKWDQLQEQLIAADIVVAATAAQDYLFEKETFREIAGKCQGELLIIDIAVPRNFGPGIDELEEVHLYSIDDLSAVVEQNRKIRQEDMSKGIRIVDESVAAFMDWFLTKDIGPLIGQMKQEFAQISQKELDRFFCGRRRDADCKAAADAMVNRIVNRLLHCVTKNIDVMAQKHGSAEATKLVSGIVREAEKMLSDLDDNEDALS